MTDRDATTPTDRALRLSAIVCTRNRSAWSTRAVQSLLDQDIPTSQLEIVVVDNASTDDTASVLSALVAGRDNSRYIFESELGLSHARNRGIAETSGDVVAFLDDDAEAVPDWARRHLDCFRSDPDVVGTGGRIELGWPQARPVWLPDGWEGMYAGLDLGDEPCELTEPLIPFGANMAFRRRALAPGTGFAVSLGRHGDDLTSGEEREFFERLRAAGGRLVYLADAGVTHYVLPDRLGRRWFLRRVWAQGRSHVLIDLVLRPPRARTYWLARCGFQAARAGGQAVGWLATCVTRRSPARRMTRLARATHAAGIAREALRAAIADNRGSVGVALSSVG
ncbi:MAG TPA: glycosyltransferase family A protein [Ilumatobacteraceae bacterium]|nr:glycosyltransferase family A protein [Ilumatobacteraceae bacterium]